MKFNTQFYIDGKWIELNDLIEKAAKWDRFITDLEKESERTKIIVEKARKWDEYNYGRFTVVVRPLRDEE